MQGGDIDHRNQQKMPSSDVSRIAVSFLLALYGLSVLVNPEAHSYIPAQYTRLVGTLIVLACANYIYTVPAVKAKAVDIWRTYKVLILIALGIALFYLDPTIRGLAANPNTVPNFQVLGVMVALAGAAALVLRK